VSSSALADDINLFLRNRWDNETTTNADKKGQVIFLLDRVMEDVTETCGDWETVEEESCTGDDCILITATSDANGSITPSTKSVTSGSIALFTLAPATGYRFQQDTGTCGGVRYGNYYVTNPVTSDCTVSIVFEPGEDDDPGECYDAGADPNDFEIFHYTPYNTSINISFQGVFCPGGVPGASGPPSIRKQECTLSGGMKDFRPSIAEIMRARPDLKYGVFAFNSSNSATQIFPVDERTPAQLETVITNNLMDSSFPQLDGTTFPTLGGLSAVHDYLSGLNSPLVDNCKYTQLIVLTNGGYANDDTSFSTNSSLKQKITALNSDTPPINYEDMLVKAAEFFNNAQGAAHNIKTGVAARVNVSIIGVNPDSSDPLFSGIEPTLASEIADEGGGIYEKLILNGTSESAKTEVGTQIVKAAMSVIDHSFGTPTSLVSPVAAVSHTRGFSHDDLFVTAFEPKTGSGAWRGNLHKTNTSSLASELATDFSNTTFSFPTNRTILTNACESGTICSVTPTGTGLEQVDIDWLFSGGENTYHRLGDIIHFRPLPVDYGNGSLYFIVGTNRGMLHLFDSAGEEKWAFLPAQLVNLIPALRKGHIAPSYLMVNKFYGVDGVPTLFRYDHDKDGVISAADDSLDRVLLFYGLRRGGAGYFSMDITDPTSNPDLLFQRGDSLLDYGSLLSATIDLGNGEETVENVETDSQESGSGCPVFWTHVQHGGVSSLYASVCSVNCGAPITSTQYCLTGTCDVYGNFGGVYSTDAVYFKEVVDGTPHFTVVNQCVPSIPCSAGSYTFDAHPMAMYAITLSSGSCIDENFDRRESLKFQGHMGLGQQSTLPLGDIQSIVGFDLTGLPTNIRITGAQLTFGHTGSRKQTAADASAIYTRGIDVYAAKNGIYGNIPGPEGLTNADCNAIHSSDNDLLVTTISAPAGNSTALGSRTTGGVFALGEEELYDLFINNSYYDARRNNTWVQFNVKRKNPPSTDEALLWGRPLEGEPVANHESGDSQFWDKVVPKLTITWECLDSSIPPAQRPLSVELAGDQAASSEVTSSPAGIDCYESSESCQFNFDNGHNVVLTAAPADLFTSWSGDDCSGTNPVCSLNMDASKNVVAVFGNADITRTLTVETTGAGSIASDLGTILCRSDSGTCSHNYANNTEVVLTATPDADKTFNGWGGDCSSFGMAETCTLTLDSNKNVSAQFESDTQQYQLTVTKTGNGTVTGNGIDCGSTCQVMIDENKPVNLTHSAAPGYAFVRWETDCTGTENCSFNMDSNKNVKAVFEEVFECTDHASKMSAHVSSNRATREQSCYLGGSAPCIYQVIGSGEIIELPYSQAANDTHIIRETSSGYYEWGSCSGVTPPQSYTLTVSRTGTGEGSVSGGGIDCGTSCGVTAVEGTTITLTATPSATTGSVFAGWSDACTGSGSCSVTLDTNKSVTAEFNLLQHTVTASVSANTGGTVSPSSRQVNHGDPTNFTLTALDNYEIDANNSSGCNGFVLNTSYIIDSVTEPCNVIVAFKPTLPDTYTVTFDLDGKGTRIGGGALIQTVAHGDPADEPDISVAAGYTFAGWDSDFSKITSNLTVTAQYTSQSYTVKAIAGANGSVSTPDTKTVEHNQTTSFTFAPSTGYEIDSVSGCGAGTRNENTYTTAPIIESCTVTASFKPLPQKIKVTVSRTGTGTGTVTSNPSGISCGTICTLEVEGGSNIALSAEKGTNSIFVEWEGNCSGTTCSFSAISTPDKFVTARFDSCYTSVIWAHVNAGRAYQAVWPASGYRATGSNDNLGTSNIATVSLRESTSGNWTQVSSCD
jgi:hypothetical protein